MTVKKTGKLPGLVFSFKKGSVFLTWCVKGVSFVKRYTKGIPFFVKNIYKGFEAESPLTKTLLSAPTPWVPDLSQGIESLAISAT